MHTNRNSDNDQRLWSLVCFHILVINVIKRSEYYLLFCTNSSLKLSFLSVLHVFFSVKVINYMELCRFYKCKPCYQLLLWIQALKCHKDILCFFIRMCFNTGFSDFQVFICTQRHHDPDQKVKRLDFSALYSAQLPKIHMDPQTLHIVSVSSTTCMGSIQVR